jgi:hypothetical protein
MFKVLVNHEEKEGRSVLVVSQLNCKQQQQQQQNLSSSQRKEAGTGMAWHTSVPAHWFSSHICRLSNQDPTDLSLSSRPTPNRKEKRLWAFFISFSFSFFSLLLVPF